MQAGVGSELAVNDAESPPLPPPASSPMTPTDSPMSAPPSPKLAASDERDAVEVTLKRMLERGKLPAATETAEPAATPKKKRSQWQERLPRHRLQWQERLSRQRLRSPIASRPAFRGKLHEIK